MKELDWIIGICSSGADGVRFLQFTGTENHVKEKLLALVNEDRGNDEDNWDFGCETENDIREEEKSVEYYGYGCYYDYHIDYTARLLSNVESL